jgi:predicted dehydrogenase
MSALRLGLIGAGWIAERHLQTIAKLDDVEVAAVADLDRERAQSVAAAAGASAHADWRAMLDVEQLDAVLVLTPPMAHLDPLTGALERGLAVYLEKPVARDRDDARSIAEAVDRSGAVVAVGYQYRALDFLPDLAAIAQQSALGLLASTSIGATAGRPWFVRQAQGGGQVLERASHHIDLQRAIAGEVEWVQAAGSRVDLGGEGRPPESDIDDVIVLTLGFRSGALGTVLVAWTRPGSPSIYTLDLAAAQASVQVRLDSDFAACGSNAGGELALRAQLPPIERGMQRFLDAVRASDPGMVACDVAEATGTLDVALACERALADGGRVRVEG